MKKLLAFLCALTLTLSLGVTAFAESVSGSSETGASGQQRIYTVATPLTWTMEIPAECRIPFGQETTEMGSVKIDKVSWSILPEGYYIGAFLEIYTGELKSEAGDSLSYDILAEKIFADGLTVEAESVYKIHPENYGLAFSRGYNFINNFYSELSVHVSADQWEKAFPGRTYEETVRYTSCYVGMNP